MERPKLEDYYNLKDHTNPSTGEYQQLELAKHKLRIALEKYCNHIEKENKNLIAYIKESPCDPDIFPEQYKAYKKIKHLI